MSPNLLSNLPSVNDLLESVPLRNLVQKISRSDIASTIRVVLDEVRQEVQTAAADKAWPNITELADRIADRVEEGGTAQPRSIINATGILLAEGLDQFPLAESALADMQTIAKNYAFFDPAPMAGRRSRLVSMAESLLVELTGAEAALVVGGGDGALMLALAALCGGREAIVPQGQVAETSGGNRLLDIIQAAGAELCAVGAVHRTRSQDVCRAITDRTGMLLRMEPSHYAVVGATEEVAVGELVAIGRERQLPVVHDLGLGALIDYAPLGLGGQAIASESVRAGVDVVVFRGDKLLGGPHCGIAVGRRASIEKMAAHPLAQILSADALALVALAATLRLYRDPEEARVTIPLLQLVSTSVENLKSRANRLAPQIAASPAVASAEAVSGVACLVDDRIPAQQLPTWRIAVRPKEMTVDQMAKLLRSGESAIVGRASPECLELDLRSVMPRQDLELVELFGTLGG
jgi:L-seryl-tRNA(Ser) seleniumtransferase